MNIRIVAVGKIKEKYLNQGIQEYCKRLGRCCKLEIAEVADVKAPETFSRAEEMQVMDQEGERILKALRDGAYVIALAIEGKSFDSLQFAQKLDSLAVGGTSNIDFVIGGSLGLCPQVLKRADLLLSFSSFTFPHQLMRLILLEQIYRAFRINRGEPYHK